MTVFEPGDVVVCRELCNGEVMTALPMRVVADSPARTVLYLAADTAFRGARTPAGGKVTDLSDWVLTDIVWAGGSFVRILEPDLWHCIDVEFDADGMFCGWYVNFQEPLRRTPSGFDTVDLVLDLVVAPDGSVRRKDEEDFAAAVAAGHISHEVASLVLADASSVTEAVARMAAPFDERNWLTWRPPAEWTVPTLPAA